MNRRRAAKAPPPSAAQVRILVLHAHGMGGTIRTVLNLAGHLARERDVEIISVLREAPDLFFPVSPAVRISFLDDRVEPRGLLRALLSRLPSVLIPKEEAAHHRFTLWTGLRLLRRLRSLRGAVLIATRPGLILAAALLAPPGVIVIGQEHVALAGHDPVVRRLIKRRYRRLDALVTLTEADLAEYRAALRHPPRHLVRIPNAVPPLSGGPADLSVTTVVAVGRMTRLKGFHKLIDAWAIVAERHPDWTLRILGAGPQRPSAPEDVPNRQVAE
jgi:glycosyltransferase involved in cell wall biosynthesis